MTSSLDQLIDTLFELKYKDTVLLKLCFSLVFYSLDLSQPDQKQAVLQMYDDYVTLYGSQLKWTTNPDTGNWKKLKNGPTSYVTPHEWLMKEPQANGFEFYYHGTDKDEDATDISFFGFGKHVAGVKRHALGIVTCRFPLLDVFSGKAVLPEIFYRWCCFLKPYHAHGGGCLGRFPEQVSMEKYYSSLEAELLLRFPGLQLFDFSEGLYFEKRQEGLYNGPRCADWLIALSDTFVEKLGGVDAIAEKMNPLPWQAYDGGIALQAGDAPGLGDKNGDSLPDYMHLAKVIEPVRAKKLSREICVPYADPMLEKLGLPLGDPQDKVTCPRELSDMWHNRFSS